ncbi:hypothetical protein OGAPHI_000299 [Ogataea philodendri]|uniref:Uncharacterized protein n=1 Tax=Ogataea philodendri TaxID=1378263 RepID=A0A9P8TA75_9ASCO|nr:uncharacterized protein OGAPHI_000299 [Ogataea philodendri]KAH3671596.1 hypothetical protein OGAPHI_000299 [Ogataea philodendri]
MTKSLRTVQISLNVDLPILNPMYPNASEYDDACFVTETINTGVSSSDTIVEIDTRSNRDLITTTESRFPLIGLMYRTSTYNDVTAKEHQNVDVFGSICCFDLDIFIFWWQV